jgi:hypothetical protein
MVETSRLTLSLTCMMHSVTLLRIRHEGRVRGGIYIAGNPISTIAEHDGRYFAGSQVTFWLFHGQKLIILLPDSKCSGPGLKHEISR